MPSKMKASIIGLQPVFRDKWNYDILLLKGPIFRCPSEGLVNFIDSHFSDQQSGMLVTKPHNMLLVTRIENLYNSKHLYLGTVIGMQMVNILDVSSITFMRLGELLNLKLNQIQKICINGEHVWLLTSVVVCHRVCAKHLKLSFKLMTHKTTYIILFNENYHETINLFQNICKYIELRVTFQTNFYRFLLEF